MSNSNPIVWVIQEGRNDYAPAEEFGEVKFITKSDFRSIEGSKQNAEVIADIRRFKAFYIAENDYIIPAGNPVVVAMVMMCLPQANHRILKWDGRRAAYIPFTLNPKMVN